MLDADIAKIYGVSTKRLNEQVKRNKSRFPSDFMFQLSAKEFELLKLNQPQVSGAHGGRRSPPNVFTEHGAVMLANVIDSGIAVDASVQVVRAFINLRHVAEGDADLARKIELLEQRYDQQFRSVFDAIRQLMAPPVSSKRKIGIISDDE